MLKTRIITAAVLLSILLPALMAEAAWPFACLTLVLIGVIVPLIQEAVKPLPALALRHRPHFGETMDGLVFGIAAGLGFGWSSTLVW